MKAPSEKHLENWLVTSGVLKTHGYIERFVGQQVVLPSGICDLMATVPIFTQNVGTPPLISLCAIELKKDCINSHAIAQCLRYMLDLREILMHVRYPEGEDAGIYREYRDCGIVDQSLGVLPEISGMVIGHGISDKNMLLACDMAGIQVLSYEYEDDTYELDTLQCEGMLKRHYVYSKLVYTQLGQALHEVIQRRLTYQRALDKERAS